MTRVWSGRAAAILTIVVVGCGGPRNRSPVCGLAMLAGPTIVQQQLNNARAILTDVPRGLPATLPARVAGQADTGRIAIGYDQGNIVMAYQGAGFPARVGRDAGYGLLVVDDSTQRAMGLLVYESTQPPKEYPRLGTVSSSDLTLPVFGVRVDWGSVSNPHCPLLGAPTTQP
ncbi:MAG TPA: hypothetical protein VMH88_04465 [Gemmatimonadales bacterium]|nr:hypothetical protein [Gemmatimonadales bacterium]